MTILPGIILLAALTSAPADEGGRIHGLIVDPAGGPLRNAIIRAMRGDTLITKYRSWCGTDGRFRMDGLQPGTYTIAVSLPGFREKFIGDVRVNDGGDTDLGTVRLEFGGCDAPGMICNFVSTEPTAVPQPSRGDLTVPAGCAVDIDKGAWKCTVVLDGPPAESPMRDPVSDFWLDMRSRGAVWLVSRNGARFAEPNSAASDCSGAIFDRRRVRIDGLGPGSDICLRTNQARYSHLFFTSEVQADMERIAIHHVTRK